MKTAPYFTPIKKGKNLLYYFQFKAPNHETLFPSEGYSTRSAAKQGQKDIVKNILLFAAAYFD